VSPHRTASCAELRALVSQHLDAPISPFERALARAHIADCAACATFEAEVGAFTALLREAELERVPRQITLPRALRYRRSLTVVRGAAATAAVAMAAVAIGGSANLAESTGVVRAAHAPANDAVRIAAPAVAVTQLVPLRELIRDDLAHGRVPMLPVLDDEPLGAQKPVLPANA
jgi:predicted anti-sigma-YlaC factor YlaD